MKLTLNDFTETEDSVKEDSVNFWRCYERFCQAKFFNFSV